MPGSEIPQTEATSALNPGPSPMIADLRTQLVSLGHTKTLLAKSETMTMHIHCYAPKGGENGMHAHIEEEHSFVCLQGEALFRGLEGDLPVLKRNQTIFLPRGCFYSFSNESDTPCILLRIGAGSQGYSDARLDPRGQPIPGRARKAGAVLPVFIEGQFFE